MEMTQEQRIERIVAQAIRLQSLSKAGGEVERATKQVLGTEELARIDREIGAAIVRACKAAGYIA